MHEVFKVLGRGGLPCHGGRGRWSLPTEEGPGDWRSVEGKLVACRNGLHLCRANRLIDWLAPCIFLAEYRGEIIEHTDKLIVREARLLRRLPWDDRTARLFACDCAERVLAHYEAVYPGEERPRQAIAKSRQFALGLATADQLAAARHAAVAAAVATDTDAALALAGATSLGPAEALWAAKEAVWAAVWASARVTWEGAQTAADKAREVARSAAEVAGATADDASLAAAAERAWQTARLLEVLETGMEESDA